MYGLRKYGKYSTFLQQSEKQNSAALRIKTRVGNKCFFFAVFFHPGFFFLFINHAQITSKHSSITLGGGCITTNACGRRMKETLRRMGLQRGDSTRIYNICSNKHTIITPPDYYHITYNEANSFF